MASATLITLLPASNQVFNLSSVMPAQAFGELMKAQTSKALLLLGMCSALHNLKENRYMGTLGDAKNRRKKNYSVEI